MRDIMNSKRNDINMKLLIAYVSRNGASRYCAELLARGLNEKAETELVDLEKKLPELNGYDAAVIGGPVRMGRFPKTLRKYLKTNTKKLSEMPCAVFFCCGLARLADEYRETLIPRKLELSLGIHHFGGELKPKKVKGLDKLWVSHLRDSVKSYDFEDSDYSEVNLPELIPENVILLSEIIKKEAYK